MQSLSLFHIPIMNEIGEFGRNCRLLLQLALNNPEKFLILLQSWQKFFGSPLERLTRYDG